ncbi:hypothetical protein L9F63_006806, partial [Diploptera punctata]
NLKTYYLFLGVALFHRLELDINSFELAMRNIKYDMGVKSGRTLKESNLYKYGKLF